MADEKKKGLFGKAVDALSSKDEKETIAKLEEELELAKKEAEEAKAKAQGLSTESTKNRLDKNRTARELEEAEKKLADLEKKMKDIATKERMEAVKERGSKLAELKAKMEAKKPAIITTHTVESNNQTLSHIALKYYKHATPPYWQYLLEHNKEVLKGSEKNVRMGMELVIPELPDELKD